MVTGTIDNFNCPAARDENEWSVNLQGMIEIVLQHGEAE